MYRRGRDTFPTSREKVIKGNFQEFVSTKLAWEAL